MMSTSLCDFLALLPAARPCAPACRSPLQSPDATSRVASAAQSGSRLRTSTPPDLLSVLSLSRRQRPGPDALQAASSPNCRPSSHIPRQARHRELLEAGSVVQRQTLGFDASTGRTFALRQKEAGRDYMRAHSLCIPFLSRSLYSAL